MLLDKSRTCNSGYGTHEEDARKKGTRLRHSQSNCTQASGTARLVGRGQLRSQAVPSRLAGRLEGRGQPRPASQPAGWLGLGSCNRPQPAAAQHGACKTAEQQGAHTLVTSSKALFRDPAADDSTCSAEEESNEYACSTTSSDTSSASSDPISAKDIASESSSSVSESDSDSDSDDKGKLGKVVPSPLPSPAQASFGCKEFPLHVITEADEEPEEEPEEKNAADRTEKPELADTPRNFLCKTDVYLDHVHAAKMEQEEMMFDVDIACADENPVEEVVNLECIKDIATFDVDDDPQHIGESFETRGSKSPTRDNTSLKTHAGLQYPEAKSAGFVQEAEASGDDRHICETNDLMDQMEECKSKFQCLHEDDMLFTSNIQVVNISNSEACKNSDSAVQTKKLKATVPNGEIEYKTKEMVRQMEPADPVQLESEEEERSRIPIPPKVPGMHGMKHAMQCEAMRGNSSVQIGLEQNGCSSPSSPSRTSSPLRSTLYRSGFFSPGTSMRRSLPAKLPCASATFLKSALGVSSSRDTSPCSFNVEAPAEPMATSQAEDMLTSASQATCMLTSSMQIRPPQVDWSSPAAAARAGLTHMDCFSSPGIPSRRTLPAKLSFSSPRISTQTGCSSPCVSVRHALPEKLSYGSPRISSSVCSVSSSPAAEPKVTSQVEALPTSASKAACNSSRAQVWTPPVSPGRTVLTPTDCYSRNSARRTLSARLSCVGPCVSASNSGPPVVLTKSEASAWPTVTSQVEALSIPASQPASSSSSVQNGLTQTCWFSPSSTARQVLTHAGSSPSISMRRTLPAKLSCSSARGCAHISGASSPRTPPRVTRVEVPSERLVTSHEQSRSVSASKAAMRSPVSVSSLPYTALRSASPYTAERASVYVHATQHTDTQHAKTSGPVVSLAALARLATGEPTA